MVGMVTYSPGRYLIQTDVRLAVSGRTQINTVITHRCKYLEEKKKKVPSRDNQEICGSVSADLVKKAWHTANTNRTSTMTFRGIYNNKQGQDVFDAKGIDWMSGDECWKAERTYHTPAKARGRSPLCCSIVGGSRSDTHRKEVPGVLPLLKFGFASEF